MIESSIHSLAAAINNLAAALTAQTALNTQAVIGTHVISAAESAAVLSAAESAAAGNPAPAAPAAPAPIPATAAAAPAAAPGSKDYNFKEELVPAFMLLMNTKGQDAARKVIDHFDPSKERLSLAVTTQAQVNEAMAIVQALMQA